MFLRQSTDPVGGKVRRGVLMPPADRRAQRRLRAARCVGRPLKPKPPSSMPLAGKRTRPEKPKLSSSNVLQGTSRSSCLHEPPDRLTHCKTKKGRPANGPVFFVSGQHPSELVADAGAKSVDVQRAIERHPTRPRCLGHRIVIARKLGPFGVQMRRVCRGLTERTSVGRGGVKPTCATAPAASARALRQSTPKPAMRSRARMWWDLCSISRRAA